MARTYHRQHPRILALLPPVPRLYLACPSSWMELWQQVREDRLYQNLHRKHQMNACFDDSHRCEARHVHGVVWLAELHHSCAPPRTDSNRARRAAARDAANAIHPVQARIQMAVSQEWSDCPGLDADPIEKAEQDARDAMLAALSPTAIASGAARPAHSDVRRIDLQPLRSQQQQGLQERAIGFLLIDVGSEQAPPVMAVTRAIVHSRPAVDIDLAHFADRTAAAFAEGRRAAVVFAEPP